MAERSSGERESEWEWEGWAAWEEGSELMLGATLPGVDERLMLDAVARDVSETARRRLRPTKEVSILSGQSLPYRTYVFPGGSKHLGRVSALEVQSCFGEMQEQIRY